MQSFAGVLNQLLGRMDINGQRGDFPVNILQRVPNDINEMVNNMPQQEFEEYMNNLYVQDSRKPLDTMIMSQLPRHKYKKGD